jgi:hypothetical protein
LDYSFFGPSGVLRFAPNGGTNITVGSFTDGVNYDVAYAMRPAGIGFFVKGGSQYPNWTLLYLTTVGAGGRYPTIQATGNASIFTAANARVSTQLFIPTPLVSDGFSLAGTTDGAGHEEANGGGGLAWTGATWTVAGGTVSNTPTQGADVIVNGAFAADTNWNKGAGWTIASGLATATNASSDLTASVAPLAIGTWYQTAFTTSAQSLGTVGLVVGGVANLTHNTNATFTETQRASTSAFAVRAATGNTGNVATVSARPLTLSTLFRSVDAGSADGFAETAVTGPTSTSGVQGGLVLNLDSAASPANFIIVYLDGAGNVKVDEAVAGVYTNKVSAAVTYSAGAVLRAARYGTSLDVYYNNLKVGSTLTMTANTNTRYGLFSTYSGNTFDNFVVWPRSGYDVPDQDLTVTRDTGTMYAGTASAKLVAAAGNAANFTQSVNVGDTSTYNLSTYAYTNGSAVTAADLGLYASGSAVTTTYTSAGGGWYQLTGTVTGTASAVGYGVRVKAGKTVYVDNMSLNKYASSGSLTSSIFDTGQGSNWGTLTYTATTPTNTTVSVKARTSNDSLMSGATAFSSCSAITSGSDISSNGCVTDTHRYIQYQLTLANSSTEVTPTFQDVSTVFAASDTTPPSGGSIIYTDGYYTSASVALTVSDGTDADSGVNTSSRIVQRDSATLSNGTCGGYGSFSTITPTGSYPNYTDTTVNSATCYQYQYLVSDNAGNQATYTSTNSAKVDTSLPTTPGTPSTTTPTNSTTQTWIWTAATDAISGIINYAWRVTDNSNNPIISGTTTSLSVVTNLAQGVYNFFVKALSGAGTYGSESQGSLTVDTTAPSGGSITYTNGYYTSASVSLTASDGTDTGGSNINTSSRIVQRKSATLTNGTCGGYGSFGTITVTGTYPNFTDTTVTSATCYQYQYQVSDNAGNQATYTSSNTVYVLSLPLSASSLAQYQSDGIRSIPLGTTLGIASGVILKFGMTSTNSSDTLTPQVEIQQNGIPFTNTPTNTGSALSFTGTPVTGTVTIPSMGGGNYHWQARVINSAGQSSWVAMGGNPDFGVEFPPAANNSSAPTGCSNQAPSSTPDLFQIDTTNTKATVYFAPSGMPYDNYVIRFGPTANNLLYSASFTRGYAPGVIYYTINELSPNTIYYFQVRAGNGCKPGDWGNTLSAKTTGSIKSTSKSYKSLGGFIRSLISFLSPKYTGSAINNSIPTPTAANNGTPGQCTKYTVQLGDSFWTIAQKLLGNGQRYMEIWKANISNYPTLKNSPVIRAGWKLSVGC